MLENSNKNILFKVRGRKREEKEELSSSSSLQDNFTSLIFTVKWGTWTKLQATPAEREEQGKCFPGKSKAQRGSRRWETWIWIPAFPLFSSVPSGKFLNFSES